jgi:hypothetical protein
LGLNVLGFRDGAGAAQSGAPVFEYVNHLQNRARRSDGQLDLGAYEYSLPLINSIQFNGNDCLVSFSGELGNQYELDYASNLIGAVWSPVRTNVAGTNGAILITDTNGARFGQRFYRVKGEM